MIEVGSNYFFKNIEGFIPHDIDYVELVNEPLGFQYVCHIRNKKKCIFKWKKMNVKDFIEYTKKHCSPMAVGKFLVKEFCDAIGFTFNDLKSFDDIFNNMDDKHLYEKKIYEYYLLNNDFYLTNDQLMDCYNEYKKYR